MDTRRADKKYQFRLSIIAAQAFGDLLASFCDLLRLFFKFCPCDLRTYDRVLGSEKSGNS